jgi:hypothetical protein
MEMVRNSAVGISLSGKNVLVPRFFLISLSALSSISPTVQDITDVDGHSIQPRQNVERSSLVADTIVRGECGEESSSQLEPGPAVEVLEWPCTSHVPDFGVFVVFSVLAFPRINKLRDISPHQEFDVDHKPW